MVEKLIGVNCFNKNMTVFFFKCQCNNVLRFFLAVGGGDMYLNLTIPEQLTSFSGIFKSLYFLGG